MSCLFQQVLKNGLMWVLVTFVLSAGASMAIAAPCGLAPTVSFDLDTGYAKAGDSVDYTVTIINNDLSACDLALGATDEKAGFTSTPDATPIVNVGSGTTVTATVTVAVDGAALDWTESITTLTVGLATPITATTTVFDKPLFCITVLTSTPQSMVATGASTSPVINTVRLPAAPAMARTPAISRECSAVSLPRMVRLLSLEMASRLISKR